MEEKVVPVKRGRKKKEQSLVSVLSAETLKHNAVVSEPVVGSSVIVIKCHDVEVERINPVALEIWVKNAGLDYSSVQRIMNRTYVNHEGYTFEETN